MRVLFFKYESVHSFIKSFLSIFWYVYMSLWCFLTVVNYIDWLLRVKLTSHFWNKLCSVIHKFCPFYISLDFLMRFCWGVVYLWNLFQYRESIETIECDSRRLMWQLRSSLGFLYPMLQHLTWIQACLLLIHLPANVQLLASAWPCLGCCEHLGTEPVSGRSISLTLLASLIFISYQ